MMLLFAVLLIHDVVAVIGLARPRLLCECSDDIFQPLGGEKHRKRVMILALERNGSGCDFRSECSSEGA